MPPVGGKPGPKREKPQRLQGDRGYDSEGVRRLLRWLRITPVLAKRKTPHGSGLGVFRWVVERTISWLHSWGRLRRRLDRHTELHQAFLQTRRHHDLLEVPQQLNSFLPVALKELASLKNLTSLSLKYTKVTNIGLKELAAHENLRNLDLHKTKVTDDGVMEFQKALPRCKIAR